MPCPDILHRTPQRAALQELPTGGRTPLAEGLLCAREILRLERIRDPRRRPLLVLVTDGRATHGPDAVARSRMVADQLRRADVASLVIDCESGRIVLGLAETLSMHLGAQCLRVDEIAADQLVHAVRQGAGQRNASGHPARVPEDGLTTRQRRQRPLLIIHTGDGKGKSTAAFGLALRGWNQGWSVGVFQFVKSAKWRIGEQTALESLGRTA